MTTYLIVFFQNLILFIPSSKKIQTSQNHSKINFKQMENSNRKTIEKEKLVAETLNGRFAMLGLIAALGAYLTTGQIIPGFV
tara:strand:+ start:84 stop:329 length:246 start_codon:yes stop_codon:yes gene_type:complete